MSKATPSIQKAHNLDKLDAGTMPLGQETTVATSTAAIQTGARESLPPTSQQERRCRFCNAMLSVTFTDLGFSPLSNAYIPPERNHLPELFYPLHARVCQQCWLVQVDEFESPETIFHDYAYFSSYSESWLKHAQAYTDMMIRRFHLSPKSQVVEIASNDGYLLQFFKEKDFPVLGIEPADNVAQAARAKGIPTRSAFFGAAFAQTLRDEGIQANVLIGNNVLAHVPALNDFVTGLRHILHPQGILTLEFPHLVRLMEGRQFDTIYHEHFSYFSFSVACAILQAHGLQVFDVERLATHGGSLRIFAQPADTGRQPVTPHVARLLQTEADQGLQSIRAYTDFSRQVQQLKREILTFLIREKEQGKRIAAYGAPAKGNTLLNHCGIGPDFIDFTVDKNPHKQNTRLPGSHIPVLAPEAIEQAKPDWVIILPWNLTEEIQEQLKPVQKWGGRCVVLIPEVRVLSF